MSQNFEIELRYEVLSSNGLEQFLAQLTFINKKQVIDIYLDTLDGDLVKKGIYIRKRNAKTVDIKFNRACLEDPSLPSQPYCEEYSFSLPLISAELEKFNGVIQSLGLKPLAIPNLDAFMTSNKLIDHLIIDKIRSSYKHDIFTIALDEIKELGTFLEIEIMSQSTENLEQITYDMKTILAGLHIKPLKFGAVTLMLRKKYFDLYLQSRFALEEDKIKATQSL